MNRETFDAGITLLSKAWPNNQASPDVYWLVLHDMDDVVFQRAVLACLETCKFFPVIAEIREKAQAILEAAGVLPMDAERAWETLMIAEKYWHPDIGWMDNGCWPLAYRKAPEDSWPEGMRKATVPAAVKAVVGEGPLAEVVQALGGIGAIYNASDHDRGFLRRDFASFYDGKREQLLLGGPAFSQPLPQLAEARP